MRRAAKIDANQPEIVQAYQDAGATVEHLHAVGGGCPDLLVGYQGKNYLIEVKDGSKKPSAQALTADQVRWHFQWRGQVQTANSVEAALNIIGIE